jgi:hypothetical protein
MRPIDIQNAIDRVQASERLLHVRKAEDMEDSEQFSKRLSEEVQQRQTSITQTEQTKGLKVEEKGGSRNPSMRWKQKRKQQDQPEQQDDSKVKEEGKGNILDLNA